MDHRIGALRGGGQGFRLLQRTAMDVGPRGLKCLRAAAPAALSACALLSERARPVT